MTNAKMNTVGHFRARPLLVTIWLCAIALCALWAYAYLADNGQYAFAVATSVLVASLIVLMMVCRPSPTDATFIFMFWALVYQVVEPWLQVTGTTLLDEGGFFIGNFRLLALGNIYFLLGLGAYAAGMWLCPRLCSWEHGRNGGILSLEAADRIVMLVLGLGFLGWLALWIRMGMPKQTLLLQRRIDITLNRNFTAGGFAYLFYFPAASNLVILVYALKHPEKPLFSPELMTIMFCIALFSGIGGERLLLIVPPISVLILRQLLAKRMTLRVPTPAVEGRRISVVGPVKLALAAMVLLGLAAVYAQYRLADPLQAAESIGLTKTQAAVMDAGFMFYTDITYYMVLERVPAIHPYWYGRSYIAQFIAVIPRIFFPSKWSYVWNPRRFVIEFYQYDPWTYEASSKQPDLMAEAFLNFGVYGIVGLMLLFGLANEFISRKAHLGPASNLFLAGYVYYICYSLADSWRGGLSSGFLVYSMAILLAAAWLAGRAQSASLAGLRGRLDDPAELVTASGARHA